MYLKDYKSEIVLKMEKVKWVFLFFRRSAVIKPRYQDLFLSLAQPGC